MDTFKNTFFISLIMPNLFERNRRIISNNCGNKFGPLSRQSLGHGPFRLDEASYTILVLVEVPLFYKQDGVEGNDIYQVLGFFRLIQ